jgi:hypothetical protein
MWVGWLPSSATSFSMPLWANRRLGLYATWEGLALQLGALPAVLGSSFLAREIRSGPRAAPARAT